MKKGVWVVFVCCALAASGGVSSAIDIDPVTFAFYNVTDNNAIDAGIGEAQLFLEVSNGENQVIFTFLNLASGQACSISEIYFDDGTLLEIDHIIDDPPDVDFQHDVVTPKQMPGGDLVVPPFVAIESFSLEPENPEPHHGVNPGEQVQVVFNLKGSGDVMDVLGELYDGTLRIGIHVIGYDSGGSESFVNVPEPGTLCLLGLGGLALLRRRRR